jgi:hypothetical protein
MFSIAGPASREDLPAITECLCDGMCKMQVCCVQYLPHLIFRTQNCPVMAKLQIRTGLFTAVLPICQRCSASDDTSLHRIAANHRTSHERELRC